MPRHAAEVERWAQPAAVCAPARAAARNRARFAKMKSPNEIAPMAQPLPTDQIAPAEAEGRILADMTDAEQAELLAHTERRSFPAGAEVLRAGDGDRTVFLIVAGSVDVMADGPTGPQRLAVIEEGSAFGEMAFFDGAPRSATIVTREPLETLALSREQFRRLVAGHPQIARKLLLALGRVLSIRLRRMNPSA